MSANQSLESSPIRRLKLELLGLALGCGASALALLLLAAGNGAFVELVPWFLGTLGGLLVLFALVWRNLSKNQRAGEREILPTLGGGTILTITRGALLAGLLGMLLVPPLTGKSAWIPGIVFLVAVLADFFDGYLARRQDIVTRLGEWLDMRLDGAAVLIGCLAAIHFGSLPFWYLPVGAAYYLFVIGIWLRERRDLPVHELPESSRRRGLAGAQMIFISVILLPLFSAPATYLAAAAFMTIFLSSFLYDWLLVMGLLGDGRNPRLEGVRQQVDKSLPLLFRFILAGLLSISAALNLSASELDGLTILALIVQLVLAVLIGIGAAGRLAALAVLLLIGLAQMRAPLNLIQVLLIFSSTLVFFTGTGAKSLWSPEGRLAGYRAGGRRTRGTE